MDTKSDDPSTSRELLEVPDHPSLAIRTWFLYFVAGKISQKISLLAERNLVVDKPPKPRISRPAANTDLLGRLQTFLPQLHKANQELDTTSHSEFEKEVVIVGNTPRYVDILRPCVSPLTRTPSTPLFLLLQSWNG